jgi:3-hydroxypropanoate dehydrogenase
MIDQASLDTLFLNARTHNGWQDKAVSDAQLHQIFDLMKMAPTSANCSPARFVFVKTDDAKTKLLGCVDAGNTTKVRTAPVTAIIGMDIAFYDKLPQLFPHTDARAWFVGDTQKIADTAFRNSSLQGAYFMLAARALGLDCSPMSGFNHDKIDATFWGGTDIKTNFICAIGYGDASKLFPRSPRFAFSEACSVV